MSALFSTVCDHLSRIYPNSDIESIAEQLILAMGLDNDSPLSVLHRNKWDETDVWVITYGDTIKQDGEAPLLTLKKFIDRYFEDQISGVHILPFFPYSSDDGFSVISYVQVNDSLGDWSDIEEIGNNYDLMADLVINHCSARSHWFDNYCHDKSPGKDYFVEADPTADLSQVTRPRTSPLLRETQTLNGKKHVWCTFSHDQVDLNFNNPKVLIEMVGILRLYLERSVRIFRLDAVAFLWKEIGTSCINLAQTHEVVKLLRTLIETHSPEAVLVTETNIPNHENLSYFGNANEAHAVYNFSLPPLLIHALLSGTSEHLKQWQMSMPPAQHGTFYFNFIASHDGIGLRPIKNLLTNIEVDQMINTLQNFGARVSWRSVEGGRQEPYEINISLFDAMQGSINGPDKWQHERFICAHAIMIALEGIPGFYIHSLIGSQNDVEKLKLTNHNRSINRRKWDYDALSDLLANENSHHAKVLKALLKLLNIRKNQAAFHPNAVQYTLHLGSDIFAFWRQSINRDQSIFCLNNMTDETVKVPIRSVNLISLQQWCDLISGEEYNEQSECIQLAPYQTVWLSNKF